jgi:tetratricopeptide (TPR) repeat protein
MALKENPARREAMGRKQAFILFALLALTALTYYPVAGHRFIKYDDGLYVTRNPTVQQGITVGNLRWAFTTTDASNWHPLTWISHMLDVQLFGLNAGAHHLVSLLLHALCVLLLYIVFHDMTGAVWRSALVAALFAVHPTHVESVAWIAERKDILSALFWFLTMLAYARYVRKPSPWRYLSVIALFATGLLTKPMLVTLPFVLLLLDYWPLARIGGPSFPPRLLARLLLEKAPLFLLAALSSVITYRVQEQSGSVNLMAGEYLGTRVSASLAAYGSYLRKAVWPADLAVFYPFSWGGQAAWKAGGVAAALLLLTAAAVALGRRWRYVPVGWLWFVGTLVPVAGLVKIGVHSSADRYLYIPLVGLAIIVAWGVHSIAAGNRRGSACATALCLATVAAFALTARAQVHFWKDTETLFSHALDVTSGNWLAHTKVGNELYARGDLDGAALHYEETLKINPTYFEALNNLGSVKGRQGESEAAASLYRAALKSRPADASIHYNLGNALFDLGRWGESASHYRRALELLPGMRAARKGLRDALERQQSPGSGQPLQ